MVYNGYYKVMSNIPKMGHLPTPDGERCFIPGTLSVGPEGEKKTPKLDDWSHFT